jgi:hypothetical protein
MLKNRSKIHWNMLCCKTNLIFMKNKKDMLQHRLPNHKMLCLTVFHLYFVILYNTMGMSHLKAYIKVGHWQVQEESKMSLKKKKKYLLAALPTTHNTNKLSFTMFLYFAHFHRIRPCSQMDTADRMWDWDFHPGVRDENVWSFMSTALTCHNYVA